MKGTLSRKAFLPCFLLHGVASAVQKLSRAKPLLPFSASAELWSRPSVCFALIPRYSNNPSSLSVGILQATLRFSRLVSQLVFRVEQTCRPSAWGKSRWGLLRSGQRGAHHRAPGITNCASMECEWQGVCCLWVSIRHCKLISSEKRRRGSSGIQGSVSPGEGFVLLASDLFIDEDRELCPTPSH